MENHCLVGMVRVINTNLYTGKLGGLMEHLRFIIWVGLVVGYGPDDLECVCVCLIVWVGGWVGVGVVEAIT